MVSYLSFNLFLWPKLQVYDACSVQIKLQDTQGLQLLRVPPFLFLCSLLFLLPALDSSSPPPGSTRLKAISLPISLLCPQLMPVAPLENPSELYSGLGRFASAFYLIWEPTQRCLLYWLCVPNDIGHLLSMTHPWTNSVTGEYEQQSLLDECRQMN